MHDHGLESTETRESDLAFSSNVDETATPRKPVSSIVSLLELYLVPSVLVYVCTLSKVVMMYSRSIVSSFLSFTFSRQHRDRDGVGSQGNFKPGRTSRNHPRLDSCTACILISASEVFRRTTWPSSVPSRHENEALSSSYPPLSTSSAT